MTDRVNVLLTGKGRRQASEQRPFPVTRKAIPGGAKINGLSPWEYYHSQPAQKRPEGAMMLSSDTLAAPEFFRKREV